jgi:tRNA-splicing ligase RtcB
VTGVLCADGHYGYAHPIGGVVDYEEEISTSGVGFDIACGNMAVRLDAHYSDIAPAREDHSRGYRLRD